MTHSLVDVAEIEAKHGVFKPVGSTLGVSAFGINQLELAPNSEGPEGLAWVGVGCRPGTYSREQ